MASGARRPDENVSAELKSAPPTEQRHIPAGGFRRNVSDVGVSTDTIPTGLRSGSAALNYQETSNGIPNPPGEPYFASSPLSSSPPKAFAPSSPRPRSSSQPVPPQSKTVAFDLGSRTSSPSAIDPEQASRIPPDRGYETDDSDSTLDDSDRHHYRRPHDVDRDRDRDRDRRSSKTYPPTPVPSSSRHHRSKKTSSRNKYQSDSESTVDLPERFDSKGRHKHEDPPDPFADLLGRFINGIESSSKKRRSTRH